LLNAPDESVEGKEQLAIEFNFDKTGQATTYVMPMVLNVSKAIREASELPLIEGCPSHRDIALERREVCGTWSFSTGYSL
jgi:hypothetical protein